MESQVDAHSSSKVKSCPNKKVKGSQVVLITDNITKMNLKCDPGIGLDANNYLKQIQECTNCSLEEAASALSESGNNLEIAIEALLDRKGESEGWLTNCSKKIKNRQRPKNADLTKIPATVCDETSHTLERPGAKKLPNLPRQDRSQRNIVARPLPRRQEVRRKKNKVYDSKCANQPQNDVKLDNALDDFDENGDWSGETIELYNTDVSFDVNIEDHNDLLKLATSEDITAESSEHEPEPLDIKSMLMNKSELFVSCCTTPPPICSIIPDVPVLFAPGAGSSFPTKHTYTFGIEDSPVDVPNQNSVASCQSLAENDDAFASEELVDSKVGSLVERKIPMHYTLPDKSFRQEISTVDNFHTISDPIYSAHTQASTSKESFDHMPERPAHKTIKVPVYNTRESLKENMFIEISEDLVKSALSSNVGSMNAQTEKFTQITPSYATMQPKSLQTTIASQPKPLVNATPASVGNIHISSLPHQMHNLHPGMPQLINHFQGSFPLLNLHGNSANPHYLELEQFQALQQRMIMEAQNQVSQHNIDNPYVNTSGELAIPKSNSQSLHQASVPNSGLRPDLLSSNYVTAANGTLRPDLLATALGHHPQILGTGATSFLPCPGFVVMNGYPNAFINSASQSNLVNQTSSLGASPLTQHQPGQGQYNKVPVSNFQNFHNLRPGGVEELGDINYQNMKQVMGLKHGCTQSSMYCVPSAQQSNDCQIGSKLQGASCSQNINQIQLTQASQHQTGSQFTHSNSHGATFAQFYAQQYLAAVAAAAAAVATHPATIASNAAQSSGLVNVNSLNPSSAIMMASHQRSAPSQH